MLAKAMTEQEGTQGNGCQELCGAFAAILVRNVMPLWRLTLS